LRGHRGLHAALSCITAAVVGAVLNLSLWLSIRVLFAHVDEVTFGQARLLIPHLESLDIASALIAIVSAVALLRFHFGLGKTLIAAAAVGFAWKMFTG
jgi:chromate transporter